MNSAIWISRLDPLLTFLFVHPSGHQQQLATYTDGERDAWVSALQAASHSRMRQHLESLQKRLKSKLLSMGLTSEAEAIEISDGNANADEATLKHNASVIGKSNFFGNFFAVTSGSTSILLSASLISKSIFW